MEYYRSITAIPKEWKEILLHKELDKEDVEDNKLIDRINDCANPSQWLYKRLIKEKFNTTHEEGEHMGRNTTKRPATDRFLSGAGEHRL